MIDPDITTGFEEDCNELLQAFVSHKSYQFKYFCEEWKEKKFHYVFYGYCSDYELVEFIENCTNIIKHLFLSTIELIDQIGVFYLLYSFYYKQPTKDYCKFRFTYDEWMIVKKFYDEISSKDPHCMEAKLMFWKLMEDDAISFVGSEKEEGFEVYIPKNSDNILKRANFKKINSKLESTLIPITNEETGMLTALEILQFGYNEMKEHIEIAGTSTQRSELLPNTTIVADIVESIKNIESSFQLKSSLNKIAKGGSTSNHQSVHKTELCTDDSESDGEVLNIGGKRYALKHRAMSNKKSIKISNINFKESQNEDNIRVITTNVKQYPPRKRTESKVAKQMKIPDNEIEFKFELKPKEKKVKETNGKDVTKEMPSLN